jgi:dGTPase
MSPDSRDSLNLFVLRERLDEREDRFLFPRAAVSRSAIRRRHEEKIGYRQAFALDADRILHSKAYTRYIDKTQVFYLVDNDHITHRVLHVQLVSKIARTIGRFLLLNEDLIEAIALGHDIGHPPFGHDGEKILSDICRKHGLPPFQHNVQSVRFLDKIERNGMGWNLTLQTLDGILCHDGEVQASAIRPQRGKTFTLHDRELAAKTADPTVALLPMTLEGCVVRLCDTIAYIGRDIEDAIELKLIRRADIPAGCAEILGNTNGQIVYRLVENLITTTMEKLQEADGRSSTVTEDAVGFSPEVASSLQALKQFNYERIYRNPAIKKGLGRIRICYERLFDNFLEHLAEKVEHSVIFTDFLHNMDISYQQENSPAAIVCDFIAGMTDAYFLRQAAACGCEVPERL